MSGGCEVSAPWESPSSLVNLFFSSPSRSSFSILDSRRHGQSWNRRRKGERLSLGLVPFSLPLLLRLLPVIRRHPLFHRRWRRSRGRISLRTLRCSRRHRSSNNTLRNPLKCLKDIQCCQDPFKIGRKRRLDSNHFRSPCRPSSCSQSRRRVKDRRSGEGDDGSTGRSATGTSYFYFHFFLLLDSSLLYLSFPLFSFSHGNTLRSFTNTLSLFSPQLMGAYPGMPGSQPQQGQKELVPPGF